MPPREYEVIKNRTDFETGREVVTWGGWRELIINQNLWGTPHTTGRFDSEGKQNMPPQKVSISHVDYFELKTVGAWRGQEELFTFPLTA